KYSRSELSVLPVVFEQHRTDYGAAGQLCNSLSKIRHKPDVNIINLTPENYPRYMNKDSKNIAYTTFETDRIPDLWVDRCNQMDAVFVTSQWCKEVFESSGVKVPVFNVPPGIDVSEYSSYLSP